MCALSAKNAHAHTHVFFFFAPEPKVCHCTKSVFFFVFFPASRCVAALCRKFLIHHKKFKSTRVATAPKHPQSGRISLTPSLTHPRSAVGMAQSPAASKKTKPGYQDTVAAYKVLKSAADTLAVRPSAKESKANKAPARPGRKNKTKVREKKKWLERFERQGLADAHLARTWRRFGTSWIAAPRRA